MNKDMDLSEILAGEEPSAPPRRRYVLGGIVVLTLVLIAVTVAVSAVISAQRRQQAEAAEYARRAAEYEERVRTLQAERKEAESELKEIKRRISEASAGFGSAMFLFTEPGERLKATIFPIMEDYGYNGLIAVSEKYFPGNAECLSAEELKDVTDLGWELCISVEKGTDVAALYRRITEAGLPAPKALYFPTSKCTDAYAAEAKSLGVSAVIAHSRDEENEDDALYYYYATGSNEQTSENLLNQTVVDSDGLALTVGFQHTRDLYEIGNFSAMVRVVTRAADQGKLEITTVTGANERSEAHKAAIGATDSALLQRKAELENELKEIRRELVETFRGEEPQEEQETKENEDVIEGEGGEKW